MSGCLKETESSCPCCTAWTLLWALSHHQRNTTTCWFLRIAVLCSRRAAHWRPCANGRSIKCGRLAPQAALQPLAPAQKVDMIAAYHDMARTTRSLFPPQQLGLPEEAGSHAAAAGLAIPALDAIPVRLLFAGPCCLARRAAQGKNRTLCFPAFASRCRSSPRCTVRLNCGRFQTASHTGLNAARC